MSDQLDLFGAAAYPAPPAAAALAAPRSAASAYPWPNAHLRAPRPPSPVAGASAESLAALASVVLLDELPPIVPGALPRVAVDRAGWDSAMAHRHYLVLRQIHHTLTPGDAEALAALSHIHLQQVEWHATGPVIITAHGLDHLQNALAGLRCASTENCDG